MAQEKKVIINPEATVAYAKDISAVITLGKEPKKEPINPPIYPESVNTFSPWGSDNLFPQQVIEEASKSTIIPPVLEWKADALCSGGLVYGIVSNDDDGEEKLTPIKDPEIDAWLKRTGYKKVIRKMCQDHVWFNNVFPQMIMSYDRSQIAQIACTDASFCRWEQQNINNNNLIENCFVNANWGTIANDFNSIKIPVLDINYDGVNKLKKRKDAYIFMYPLYRPSPGKIYYQVAAWNGLRESGWLDVATAIPLFKKSLMKNQLSIKYHIQIAYDWWSWKYPDFYTLSPVKRKEIVQDELDTFNDMMTGAEKSGKSIMSVFKTDPHTGKQYDGWKIEVIDDKIKDGVYVEDSQEASSHHYSALGVDPTLIGSSPGKMMGAGSGSDKRIAFNIYINRCKSDQDIILEPFEFIAEYNGWTEKHPGLAFWFRNYWISTLDQGETKSKTQAEPKVQTQETEK